MNKKELHNKCHCNRKLQHVQNLYDTIENLGVKEGTNEKVEKYDKIFEMIISVVLRVSVFVCMLEINSKSDNDNVLQMCEKSIHKNFTVFCKLKFKKTMTIWQLCFC